MFITIVSLFFFVLCRMFPPVCFGLVVSTRQLVQVINWNISEMTYESLNSTHAVTNTTLEKMHKNY